MTFTNSLVAPMPVSAKLLAVGVCAVEKETLGQLVRRLRKERGLTQGQVATYGKITRPWLSLVETDRIGRADPDLLRRLASALRVPADTLLAAAGYSVTPVPMRERRTPDEIVAELQAAMRDSPILVPLVEQPASAGPGGATEVEHWPYTPTPEERGHDFIAVEVRGDCMEPRLRPGEIAIIDRNASPRDGDIVLAVHEGEAVVKLLQQRNGDAYLVALRREERIKVNGETHILGVVRMVMHRP